MAPFSGPAWTSYAFARSLFPGQAGSHLGGCDKGPRKSQTDPQTFRYVVPCEEYNVYSQVLRPGEGDSHCKITLLLSPSTGFPWFLEGFPVCLFPCIFCGLCNFTRVLPLKMVAILHKT